MISVLFDRNEKDVAKICTKKYLLGYEKRSVWNERYFPIWFLIEIVKFVLLPGISLFRTFEVWTCSEKFVLRSIYLDTRNAPFEMNVDFIILLNKGDISVVVLNIIISNVWILKVYWKLAKKNLVEMNVDFSVVWYKR